MQQIEQENLKKLGERIRQLRLKKSISLNKLIFSKGGISTATWSRLENGLVEPKFNTLIKISAILEIDLITLLKDINIDYTLTDD